MKMNRLLECALEYSESILTGEIPSHNRVYKQISKSKYEYEIRQYEDNFPYYFDIKKVNKINNIMKLFMFSKGIYANQPVLNHINGYQATLIVNLFGWRFKNDSAKMRFRDIVLYIARKNSKTYTVAFIMILLLLTEDNYSEFYSICISKDLASEVKKAMEQTINCSPALKKYFKISKNKLGRITCTITKSFYEPRTSEAGSNNSINPSAFVSDEHANFKDKANYNAMRSGQRQTRNPISFITTTGYPLSDSIMVEELAYIDKLLDGVVQNDRYYALCYSAELEHLYDDIGIAQANPLYSEDLYNEIRECKDKALLMDNEKVEYLTKSMNVMLETQQTNQNYLDMELWRKQALSKTEVYSKYSGQHISVGVDLSQTIDLTSVSVMCKIDEHLYCSSVGFLAENQLDNPNRTEKLDYRFEATLGNVIIQEGRNSIDVYQICEYIKSIETEYNCIIDCIYYDNSYASIMEVELGDLYDMVQVGKRMSHMSPYLKRFRDELYDGKIYYAENNVLNYCTSCSQVEVGKVGDLLLTKNRRNRWERIDLLQTLIYAYEHWYMEEEPYDPNIALEILNLSSF